MKMRFLLTLSASALLLAACASYDGHCLGPGKSTDGGLGRGKSTEAEVPSLMGTPADTRNRPNGDHVLYFSRLPLGRDIYAATIGADGTLRSLDQTLTRANISRIAVNSTTADQLRELLGPPYRSVRLAFKPYDVWE